MRIIALPSLHERQMRLVVKPAPHQTLLGASEKNIAQGRGLLGVADQHLGLRARGVGLCHAGAW